MGSYFCVGRHGFCSVHCFAVLLVSLLPFFCYWYVAACGIVVLVDKLCGCVVVYISVMFLCLFSLCSFFTYVIVICSSRYVCILLVISCICIDPCMCFICSFIIYFVYASV